jgi:hypothetical protein
VVAIVSLVFLAGGAAPRTSDALVARPVVGAPKGARAA